RDRRRGRLDLLLLRLDQGRVLRSLAPVVRDRSPAGHPGTGERTLDRRRTGAGWSGDRHGRAWFLPGTADGLARPAVTVRPADRGAAATGSPDNFRGDVYFLRNGARTCFVLPRA